MGDPPPPDPPPPPPPPRATAFSAFVEASLASLAGAAGGRSQEMRSLKAACDAALAGLRQPGGVRTPLNDDDTHMILEPLRLACACSDARVVEPALACLHKLVSHAYIQGESSPSGALDDGTVVARVVAAAASASARPGAPPAIALGALQTLLAACTADHFVPHGDTLMAAVRAQFAAALGGPDPARGAARGALLQTLATSLKRVAHAAPLSRDVSGAELGWGVRRGGGDGGHLGAAAADAGAVVETAAAGPPPPAPAAATVAPAPPELDAAMGTARAAQIASLAERGDVAGLEAALDALEGERGAGAGDDAPAEPPTPAAAATAATPAPWHPPRRGLSLAERDAVALLTAVCRMAAHDGPAAGAAAAAADAAAPRALAADLLTRLLDAPGHGWESVRPPLADALRRPLSLVLLRAAAAPPGAPPAAAGAALLAACLRLRPLRAALKAEIGAFYPLLILRPAEGDWWADAGAAAGAAAALRAARAVAAAPQPLVDLFVNFDCDLHAANLVERTLKAAARAAGRGAGAGGAEAAAAGAAVLEAAAAALDAWAAPLAPAPAPDGGAAPPPAPLPSPLPSSLDPARPPSAASLASADGAAALADVAPRRRPSTVEGGGAPSPAPTPRPPDAAAAAQADAFAAAKERKHSLAAGVAVFNRDPAAGVTALVASGCVPPDPAALAAFLRDRAGDVDPASLGLLFGSPDATHVDILRAYARLPSYRGAPLDVALRAFLSGFRLPGEAQQIDRIVQAFADAYAEQQVVGEGAGAGGGAERGGGGAPPPPAAAATVLASPDVAYLVAFALVMLNTDAHHPAAPASLTPDDFAGMCEAAAGGALPRGELDAMFARVVASEIAPPRRPGDDPDADAVAACAPPRPNAAARLAAALGLPGAGARSRWDKGAAAAAERARALGAARAALEAGGGAAHLWHEAAHAEHARPILMAGGDAAVRGLAAAVAAAADAPAAQPPLDALATLVRLGATLGLDALVDAGVAALAGAAGLDAPPPRGGARERVGVAAVATLLAVAAGPAAAGLGGGWVPVLRVLSRLDELAGAAAAAAATGSGGGGDDAASVSTPGRPGGATPASVATPLDTPERVDAPPPVDGTPARVAGGGLAGGPAVAAAAAASGGAAPPPPLPAPPARSSAFARLFGGVGLADAAAPAPAPADGRFAGPGAALADWVLSPPGAATAAAVLAAGPALCGEGGVVYARALAAVGTEELAAAPPRLWALAALAAAAGAAASRGVRAHATRVWAVAAAHLAAAACSDAEEPAAAAVAALARLADALLPRAAGGGCALHAAELLKPFESAARGGASASVREAAVAAAGRALAAHGRRLPPPAWAAALRVLTAGACDPTSAAVVGASLDAAGPAVEGLYAAPGARAGAVAGLAAALGAAMRNPAHEQLSVGAAFALQGVARRLADAGDEAGRVVAAPASPRGGAPADAPPPPPPWDAVLAAFASVARHDPRPVVADAAAAALAEAAAECAPRWGAAAWRAYGGHALRYALDLPAAPDDAAAPTDGGDADDASGPPSAAPRPVGWSVEGVARLLRHARAHGPPAAALVAAHLPASRPALRPLLSLTVRYCLAPDARAAAAGAALLEAVVAAALPAADDASWGAVRAAARAASRGDVLAGLTVDVGERGGGEEDGGAATPLGALPPAPDAATAAGAARARARSALLVQRALAAALTAAAAAAATRAPASRLDDVAADLAASAARAAAANRDAAARAAAAALLSGDGGAAAVDVDGGPAAPPPPLARQEAEGGTLLLAALAARAAADPAAASGDALLAAAASILTGAQPPSSPPTWADDAVGPLLVAALDAAAAAPPAAWRARGRRLLPSLAALARDRRPRVRAALAGLLEARVGGAL